MITRPAYKSFFLFLSPLLLVIYASSIAPVNASITIFPLFSSHAVLQRDDHVPIWGKSGANEPVTVTLADEKVCTRADEQGHWKVVLNLEKAPPGPHTLVVRSPSGEATAEDIMLGEVWMAAGQSNMEFPLARVLAAEAELALPPNPQLRYFTVPHTGLPAPSDDVRGEWVVDTAATRSHFSAVAYFCGKELQRELQCPVGMIESAWSGSACEAWTSMPTIKTNAAVRPTAEKLWAQDAENRSRKDTFSQEYTAWLRAAERADSHPDDSHRYADENVPTNDWTAVHTPGIISGSKIPDNGVIWLRKDINVDASLANHPIHYELGLVCNAVTVFWNGTEIQRIGFENYPGKESRHLGDIEASLVKPGRNVIALRLYAPLDPPQFHGKAPVLYFSDGTHLSLEDSWLAKTESGLPPLPASERSAAPSLLLAAPEPNRTASYLYNGMVHPLRGLAMRGVIWYQGEDNSNRAWQYQTSFSDLITDWRTQWDRGDFPFLFCQIPNYGKKHNQPSESIWAELREAQFRTLALPHTGMAVLIDVGEAGDLHPLDKQPVGERLARLALSMAYDRADTATGPMYDFMAIEGDSIRVFFKTGTSPLATLPLPDEYVICNSTGRFEELVRNSPNSQLEGFSVYGSDGRWRWADAHIDGNTVVVHSNEVDRPQQVRYGWADNPTCSLGNVDGLPASPFRSDAFDEITRDHVY